MSCCVAGEIPRFLRKIDEAFCLRCGTESDAKVAAELYSGSQPISLHDVRFHGHGGASQLIKDRPAPWVGGQVGCLESGQGQLVTSLPDVESLVLPHAQQGGESAPEGETKQARVVPFFYGHTAIRPYGHTAIRPYGDTAIRRYGDTALSDSN